MAKLRISKLRRLLPLDRRDGTLTIGRASDNDLVLSSRSVSRHHCRIEIVHGTAARILDLGSHFGTKVNGRKVTDAPLAEGDHIDIGRYQLTYITTDEPHPDLDEPQDSDDTAAGSHASGCPEATDEPVTVLADTTEREDREAEITTLREQLDLAAEQSTALRGQVEVLESDLESSRQHSIHLEQELRSAEAQLEETRHDAESRQAESERQVSAAASEIETLRQESSRAGRDLETASRQLQQAEADTVSLRAQVAALEAAEEAAVDLAARRGRALEHLIPACHELQEASQRVASCRREVTTVETMWLHLEDRLEEAEQQGGIDARLLGQREAVARRLEQAHEVLDTAVANLLGIATRVAALANAERREIAAIQNGVTTKPPPSPHRLLRGVASVLRRDH